jgi:hypothetical protein
LRSGIKEAWLSLAGDLELCDCLRSYTPSLHRKMVKLIFADVQHLGEWRYHYRRACARLAKTQARGCSLGLLESAFNTRFSAKDFLETASNGTRVVQTAYLRKWIDDYHSTVILHPPDNPGQRRTQKNRLVESLEYAAFWNQRLVVGDCS